MGFLFLLSAKPKKEGKIMGQYYNAFINGQAYAQYCDKEYVMAKLMEHSWWNNNYVLSIASKLWRKKGRLAWVGDYADECKQWREEYSSCHTDEALKNLKWNGFTLDGGKALVNYDKKQIVNLIDYREKAEDDWWIINPLPLLTAVGNGLGGGDYHGSQMELVGSWAYDEISIEPISKVLDETSSVDGWVFVPKKEFCDFEIIEPRFEEV